MTIVQRQSSLLQEIARAVYGLGYTLRKAVSAEPVPYWADYLRDERAKNN